MNKIIILDNKKCQFITDDIDLFKKLYNYLSFKLVGVEYSPAYQNGWNGFTYLLSKGGKFNYGLLTKVKLFLDSKNAQYMIEDKRLPVIINPILDIDAALKKHKLIPRAHQIKIRDITDQYDRGIIRAATGSGKCSSVDSLHITEYGLLDYSELQEMIKLPLNVGEAANLEMNLATPLTDNKIDRSSSLYNDGYGISREIITNYGFTLTATLDHKIKIINSNGDMVWETFNNLKCQDYAVISYDNQLFGKEQISLDDAYWYGLLIGDGCLVSKTQVKLTNMDKHILDFAQKYIKRHKILYSKIIKTKTKAFDIIINNKGYRKKLEKFGFDYSKSIHKTLPLNIRKLSKKPLSMVLRGIYETDGWVEKDKPAICLSLSNKKLIDQIHLILLNFGIVASRRLKKTTHEDSHQLTIYKEFIPTFIKEIGFYSRGRKYKELNRVMKKNNNTKINSNTNLIPNQNIKIDILIDKYITLFSKKLLLENCPISWNTLRSWKGNNSWRLPSKNKLTIFINWISNQFSTVRLSKEVSDIINNMLSLCNNKYYYLPILNINETCSHNYDFVVPKTHSFVSQGFINHNTLCTALITAKLNKPTIIYVIGLDLLDQFHKLFSKLFDEPIGYIGNGICKIERINIASIWTIGCSLKLDKKNIIDDDTDNSEKELDESNQTKIIKLLNNTKLHIFDESHIVTTNTISEIYKNIDPEYIYGFSGTPFRDDNSDLQINGILGEQIINVSASELIELNLLATPLIKFYTVPKLTVSNTYTAVYKEYIVENDIRNDLIVKISKELIDKKYTPLALFKQIKHGDILLEKFQNAGIRCGMLYGNDSLQKRNQIKDQLIKKEIDLILASTIFDIGLDLPELSALVLCGGGKSSIRALQRIGRVIRPIPGKKFAAVVDFFDQVKFLKKHSVIRYKIYSSEKGFKVFKSKEMK